MYEKSKPYLSYLPNQLRRLIFLSSGKSWYLELGQMQASKVETGHSLIGFDRTKSIFFHLSKCVGVSFSKALYGDLGGGHRDVTQYLLFYGAFEFDRRFKFSICRHPETRLVSAFKFLKNGGMNKDDREFSRDYLSDVSDINAFVKEYLRREAILSYIHFTSQSGFIIDPRNGKIAVDHLGKFENIENEFKYLSSKIDADENNLPRLNSSSNPIDRKMELDEESRSIIREVYAVDFKTLGYESID